MPAPAKNARPEPQDHLPKKAVASAAKEEAAREPIKVEYDGIVYEIDPDNANNLELLEMTEDGQYIRATRGFLGVDQWEKWKDSVRDEKGRVPADGFEPFLNKVMEAIGGAKDGHPNS